MCYKMPIADSALLFFTLSNIFFSKLQVVPGKKFTGGANSQIFIIYFPNFDDNQSVIKNYNLCYIYI